MSGSRSKKSGGKYDNPKTPDLVDSTKYENVHKYGKPKPEIMGSGMASKAGKKLEESRNERFPDPSKY